MNMSLATDEKAAGAHVIAKRPQIQNLSRRLLRGGAWSVLGRAASMGAMFAANVVLARTLLKEDYSAFLAVTSLVPFLSMLATLGNPYIVVRALRGHWTTPESAGPDRWTILRGALQLTFFGTVAVSAVMLATAPLLPEDAKWVILRQFPLLLCIWFGLSAGCQVCASYLQGIDDFRMAAIVGARNGGVVANFVTAVGVGAAAWIGWLSLQWIIQLQVIGNLAAAACAAIVVPATSRWSSSELLKTRPSDAGSSPIASSLFGPRWYLLEGWPNLINQLIAVALIELDLFWVTCLAPADTVADYGVVRNLRVLVTAPLLVATIALAPFVAELYGKGELRRLERVLRGTATLLAIPSLAALGILLAFPREAIAWTFGADFVEAANALRIASIGCIIFVISGNNGLTLTMTGRHRALMICSLVSLGLYLAISPYLISHFGVTGAATAFSAQVVFQNVIVTLWVRKATGIWTVPLFSPSEVFREACQLWLRLKTAK
jgi:O-antigen/teichoic acid export membrane protein